MAQITKQELQNMMHRCYSAGLTGGVKITPYKLEDGSNVSKDVNYFYHNSDVKCIFYFGRCPSGVWYDLIRIRFENLKTGRIDTYFCKQEDEQ